MECVDDIIKELDILKEKIGDSRKTTVCHLVKTSSDKAPNNQSWIEYWEENVNTPLKDLMHCECCRCDKKSEDFVGAHVVTIDDNKKWIYPICKECNSKYQSSNYEDAQNKPFKVFISRLCPLPS